MGNLMGHAGPRAEFLTLGGILWLLIAAGFLLLGASVAGIEKRSYGKSLVATFFGLLAWAVTAALLRWLPIFGYGIASLGGFIVSVMVTQSIFSTTFVKALVAEIVSWVASAIILGGLWFLLLLLGIAVLAG